MAVVRTEEALEDQVRVFLDDLRSPPDGTWVVVRTAQAALDLLKAGGVSEISLDNDLGDGEPEGYTVANWIERQTFMNPDFRVPKVRVHSANAVARARMTFIVERIEAEAQRRARAVRSD